jgi:hypothetical protein
VTRTHRGIAKAAALIATILVIGISTVGFPALLFSAALLGGLVVWAATTLRTPIDPGRIIVPYLVTVILFLVHVLEEYITHIEQLLSTISGHTITQPNFLLLAAFFAPAFWVAGAALLLKGSQWGEYIASTFYFGMIAGELSHFIFPFMEDGHFHYASGMITAVPLIASAAYTLRLTVRAVRAAKDLSSSPVKVSDAFR